MSRYKVVIDGTNMREHRDPRSYDMPRIPRTCAHCGTPFVAVTLAHSFCTKRCKSRHHERNRRLKIESETGLRYSDVKAMRRQGKNPA